MSVIRTSVDKNLFLAASDILATLGLDMNSAVRMFLQGVVLHNGIPFDLRLTEAQAQALRQRKQTNRQATLEARDIARTGGPSHASVQAMLAAMEHETHQDEA